MGKNVAVLKTVVQQCTGGSNPSLSETTKKGKEMPLTLSKEMEKRVITVIHTGDFSDKEAAEALREFVASRLPWSNLNICKKK